MRSVDVDVGLNEFVVGDPVREVESSILVEIEGGVEELFEGLFLDFSEEDDQKEGYQEWTKYHY